MTNLVDSFATIFEAIEGAEHPREQMAPDSLSFYGVFRQAQAAPRKSMAVTNAQGIFAVRKGPWKFIEGELPQTWPENKRKGDFEGQAVRQLFHLVNDPGEKDNVIDAHPEVAESLQLELDAIRK